MMLHMGMGDAGLLTPTPVDGSHVVQEYTPPPKAATFSDGLGLFSQIIGAIPSTGFNMALVGTYLGTLVSLGTPIPVKLGLAAPIVITGAVIAFALTRKR